jgi:hypothetical protein
MCSRKSPFSTFKLSVIIFVWFGFYKKKIIKLILKKIKPVQTDQFRFGLIFLNKTGSNQFCSVFSGFFRFGFGFFDFRLINQN